MFQTFDIKALLAKGNLAIGLDAAWLLGCLGLALAICWVAGRRRDDESVWLGRYLVDGVLFPVLALVFTYAAYKGSGHHGTDSLLALAVPILISLAAIRLFARVLRTVYPQSPTAKIVERFLWWMAWLTAVGWTTGIAPSVLHELDQITLHLGKNTVSLKTLIDSLVSCGVVLVLVLWLSKAIERKLLRSAVQDLSMRKVLVNVIRAVMLVLGIVVALSLVGVDLTALSVLGGALGVGLGLGLQKLAANYVSGFVILLERSLRIGDNVTVDGFSGVVVDIKTRYTLVRSNDGRESVVPNDLLVTQRVENLSLADPKVLLMTHVTVGYNSDVTLVVKLLEGAAGQCARVLQDPAPGALLVNLGDNGLEFNLTYWIADPQNGQLNVTSEVNIAVLAALRANAVDIPLPQRVVHVSPSVSTRSE